uniref:Uncharacterized protein n=1 Tax=Arundo donax TaxID=35708 RepID=A0A0A9F497_ARUDO
MIHQSLYIIHTTITSFITMYLHCKFYVIEQQQQQSISVPNKLR